MAWKLPGQPLLVERPGIIKAGRVDARARAQGHSPQANVRPTWLVSSLKTHFHGFLRENTLNSEQGQVHGQWCSRSRCTPAFLGLDKLCLSPQGGWE